MLKKPLFICFVCVVVIGGLTVIFFFAAGGAALLAPLSHSDNVIRGEGSASIAILLPNQGITIHTDIEGIGDLVVRNEGGVASLGRTGCEPSAISKGISIYCPNANGQLVLIYTVLIPLDTPIPSSQSTSTPVEEDKRVTMLVFYRYTLSV